MTPKKEEMTKEIKELKDTINSLLTKESSKEEIDSISKVSSKIDEFQNKVNSIYDENSSLKEKLIDYIRTGGDNKPPTDDNIIGERKSLEQCLKEIKDNRK
jgi:predicted nuclease with TOPRIM domain